MCCLSFLLKTVFILQCKMNKINHLIDQLNHVRYRFVLFDCINQLMMRIYCILLVIAVTYCSWPVNHEITGQASKDLASGIRAQMLNYIYIIRNATTKQALLKDLNEPDDSKRTLKEIDDPSVDDIFEIFKLENPKCDKNNDGVVSGEELKCFGKIWKNFVPNG